MEPRLDGAYELFFDPSNHDSMSTKGCRITKFKPRSLLAFQWKGPDQYAQLMNTPPETHVEVTLTPKGQSTIMAIRHTGWGRGSEWQEAKEWHDRAWQGVISELKKHLTQDQP
ncbi:SRPBCC domain-containing protein [Candidatus Bathyarchaeota archaeon]|nr:SRPBCC domain-containing protein [Candidatus Bathyarchaeota archaeon]